MREQKRDVTDALGPLILVATQWFCFSLNKPHTMKAEFWEKDFLKLQFPNAAPWEIMFTNGQLPYQGILLDEV